MHHKARECAYVPYGRYCRLKVMPGGKHRYAGINYMLAISIASESINFSDTSKERNSINLYTRIKTKTIVKSLRY